MRKHIGAFTYKPKIERVLNYEITQTIRVGWTKEVGDLIMFHGWEGKPRHSKWSWRMPYVEINMALKIYICKDGFEILSSFDGVPIDFYSWESEIMDRLAELDSIVPPTGVELGRVIIDGNNLRFDKIKRYEGQIIRWGKPLTQERLVE